MFNKQTRDMVFNKNVKNSDSYEHVEVLPAKKEKETSDIEKRFKEPLKKLSKVEREINSLGNEMKHRMREVRKNEGTKLEFEKDMFQTRASLLDSKIKISDKQARIIKDMYNTEIKDKKLQQDTSGVSGGTNQPDMRGNFAQYFSNKNKDGGMNSSFLSNPERISRNTQQSALGSGSNQRQPRNTPRHTQNDQQRNAESTNNKNTKRTQQQSSNSVDLEGLKEKFGIDYSSSSANLQHRGEQLEEVVHIDEDNDVYWVEVYDDEGNELDNVRHKNIDHMGELKIDEKEGIARDSIGENYPYKMDNIENMPDEYYEQWDEKGTFDEDKNNTEE